MEDLEACGPGRAVVEMEQPSPGVDLKASGPGKAAVVMKQPCLGGDMEKCTSVPKRKNSDMDRKGSFPKCAGEQPAKPNKLAGRPTNVKKESMPENVQNLLSPTNNTKEASKLQKTNVSTRKVVKFENINLLENRLEIVSDVVVVDSTVK